MSELTSNRDDFERQARESREAVSGHTKTVEKRIGRLEQRLKSLGTGSTERGAPGRPECISFGTQVCDTDLGVKAKKCCDHKCTSPALNSGARCPRGTYENISAVSENLSEEGSIQSWGRDSYLDRSGRGPTSCPVGVNALRIGGKPIRTTCGDSGPGFGLAEDVPVSKFGSSRMIPSQSAGKRSQRSGTAGAMQTVSPGALCGLQSNISRNQGRSEADDVCAQGSFRQQSSPVAAERNVWFPGSPRRHGPPGGGPLQGGQMCGDVPRRGPSVSDLLQSDPCRIDPGLGDPSSRVVGRKPLLSTGQVLQGGSTEARGSVDEEPRKIPTRISRSVGVHSTGDSSGQHDIDDFILHVRKKTRRFYVGQFTSGITEQCIRAFIRDKNGPKVDKINFFQSRNGSDVFLRVCVEVENSNVLTEPDFWPDDVHCRSWFSRNAYMRKARQSRGRTDDRLSDQ